MKFSQSAALAALFVLCTAVASADASIIAQYRVSSTSVINANDDDGNPAPHGLWTGNDLYGSAGSGSSYYDIQEGMLFTQYSDGTASLQGTAINPYGSTAEIDMQFGNFASSVPNPATDYKQESGLAYDANLHDFYGSVLGTITFNGTDEVVLDNFVNAYSLQFGLGANAKSTDEFGGSAWIQDSDSNNSMGAHHWDLNLVFDAIPEPTTGAIWAMLFGTLVSTRHRRKSR